MRPCGAETPHPRPLGPLCQSGRGESPVPPCWFKAPHLRPLWPLCRSGVPEPRPLRSPSHTVTPKVCPRCATTSHGAKAAVAGPSKPCPPLPFLLSLLRQGSSGSGVRGSHAAHARQGGGSPTPGCGPPRCSARALPPLGAQALEPPLPGISWPPHQCTFSLPRYSYGSRCTHGALCRAPGLQGTCRRRRRGTRCPGPAGYLAWNPLCPRLGHCPGISLRFQVLLCRGLQPSCR